MSTINELIETTQKYFKEHNEIECQGHDYLRNGLCGCYEILLRTTDDEIKLLLSEGKITKKYKKENKAKYILWLTMGKPKSKKKNPFYEKESCRMRMYARLLKQLEEVDANIEDARKFIDDYGIYAIANLKKLKNREDNTDSEKPKHKKCKDEPLHDDEFDEDDTSDNESDNIEDEDYDEEEEDDEDENNDTEEEDNKETDNTPKKSSQVRRMLKDNGINKKRLILIKIDKKIFICQGKNNTKPIINFIEKNGIELQNINKI